jgi:glycine betaine/proline transport system ATP-binding protein
VAKIRAENLHKIFGEGDLERAVEMIGSEKPKDQIRDETGCVVAVADASFDVQENEIFVIMGLSGSGKSTLLRCLNRLVEPTRGSVTIDETCIGELDEDGLRQFRQDNLSMVFQHFGLLPHRNVIRNVEFGLELRDVPRQKRRETAEEAIEMVGLQGSEKQRIDQLSGGMQQRVGLARAFAPHTPILLMDEAFSALDPLIRAEMHEEFLALQQKHPRTIVFISHDLDESVYLGDRIAIMKDGYIVRLGAPEEIVLDPQSDYVANFVENVNRGKIITARRIMQAPERTFRPETPVGEARDAVGEAAVAVVVDEEDRFRGFVPRRALEGGDGDTLNDHLRDDVVRAAPTDVLEDLLEPTADAELPVAVLEGSTFRGWVTRSALLRGLKTGGRND